MLKQLADVLDYVDDISLLAEQLRVTVLVVVYFLQKTSKSMFFSQKSQKFSSKVSKVAECVTENGEMNHIRCDAHLAFSATCTELQHSFMCRAH